jgi:uncharacterized protein
VNIQYILNNTSGGTMPTPFDLSFAILGFIAVTCGAAYFNRGFTRRMAEGDPDARRNWYRGTMVGEWALAALAIAAWHAERRPWSALGLVPPTGWRLYVGAGLAVVVAALLLRQTAKFRSLAPDRLERLVPKFAGVELVVPHSVREYQWFMAVSWTAGVCEELLYRGFLTWVVAAYMGTAAALLIVSLAFGLGHAYQGRSGVVKTGVVGLLLGCIVLLSGWLIPAIIIHALIDLSSGVAGFIVLGEGNRRLVAE